MKKIIKLFQISKKQLFFILVICVISASIQTLYSIILKPMIDNSLKNKEIDQNYMKLFLFFIFISIMITFFRKLIFSITCINVEKNLSYKVNNAVSKINITYFDDKKEGEIVSILTKKNTDLKEFFDNSFEKIIFNPINFLFTMVGILIIDYKIAVILIPAVLLSIFIDFKLSNRIIKSSKTVFELENDRMAYQKEIVENFENIKMNKIEKYLCNKHLEKTDIYLKEAFKMLKDYQIAYIPSLLNEYLPTILLLVISIYRISKNDMSYGTFLSSLNLIFGASLPFSHFLRAMTNLKREEPKICEINELFEKMDNFERNTLIKNDTEINNKFEKNNIFESNDEKISLKDKKEIIKIENIDFYYKNLENSILKQLNLRVFKNEKVGIIGKTGSGKSTLLKIILGLYFQSEGKVEIFNENTKNNFKNIWNKTGYLDNNTYLFDGTVCYNITLLDRELSSEEEKKLKKIVKLLKIDTFFYKNIEQFGANLSGGQKLKISIARALYKEAELFIFDEPTSALDEDSETILSEIISKIEATVLIVTHREKILNICDKVFELKNKKLNLIKKRRFENENKI